MRSKNGLMTSPCPQTAFFRVGIHKLLERQLKVIKSNGE